MKKSILFVLLFVSMQPLFAASSELAAQLPLLRKYHRTAEENQHVLSLFRTAKDPDTVFAAGASLVKIPPEKIQEPALFNVLLQSTDALKQTFAAVILTAMGSGSAELSPVLQNGASGQDPVLRAYATAAMALVKPQPGISTDEIVRLYIFDANFAARAMHAVAATPVLLTGALEQSLRSDDVQVRSAAATWLTKLHTQEAAQLLVRQAKREKSPEVQTVLATGLADAREWVLADVERGLARRPSSAYASTCALALGFMTGNGTDTVRRGLAHPKRNVRINAARAAAYMAGVLANPDAFAYSSDRKFDSYLLKGLIAPLSTLTESKNAAERQYAENALRQIEKLME